MSRGSIFVGHVFDKAGMEDLRRAIKEGAGNFSRNLVFADDKLHAGHLFDGIKEMVNESDSMVMIALEREWLIRSCSV